MGLGKASFWFPDLDFGLLKDSSKRGITISVAAAQAEEQWPGAHLETVSEQENVAEPEREPTANNMEFAACWKNHGKGNIVS